VGSGLVLTSTTSRDGGSGGKTGQSECLTGGEGGGGVDRGIPVGLGD
jgi:hypothetical protein